MERKPAACRQEHTMRIQPVVVFETIAFESKYLKMCKERVEAITTTAVNICHETVY
jgi:hypothetical protein